MQWSKYTSVAAAAAHLTGRVRHQSGAKHKRSRDNWKQKAACRAENKLRYQSKELARVKAERDRFKKELKESRAGAHQLESQSRVVLIQSKVDLVFLALQLFVVARIGFRAVVSRVLGIVMVSPGYKKKSLVHRPSSTG